MTHTLFLQSENPNPYTQYAQMRASDPVFWDKANQIWALYTYGHCQYLLQSNSVAIPPVSTDQLSETATKIVNYLCRLANGAFHAQARSAAHHLFEQIHSIDIPFILQSLLPQARTLTRLDWVETICKKLPALALLHGFGFTPHDIDNLLPNIHSLTKLMLPNKNEQQIYEINTIIDTIYKQVADHLKQTSLSLQADSSDLYISNLIGLLIQSYDATRGLLSNALLALLTNSDYILSQQDFSYRDTRKVILQKMVWETLRHAPPIHHTRRILTEDLLLKNHLLQNGQQVILVLASANRDPEQFKNPDLFNLYRINVQESLSFGTGPHTCIAKHFTTELTVQTIDYLLHTYSAISLLDSALIYEPLLNARLPRQIWISLS